MCSHTTPTHTHACTHTLTHTQPAAVLVYPSLLSHFSLDHLLHPPQAFISPPHSPLSHSHSLTSIVSSFPCDLHLVNLRSLFSSEPTPSSAALILHHRAFDCGFNMAPLQCEISGGKVNTVWMRFSHCSKWKLHVWELSFTFSFSPISSTLFRPSRPPSPPPTLPPPFSFFLLLPHLLPLYQIQLAHLFKKADISEAMETTLSLLHDRSSLSHESKLTTQLDPMEIHTYRLTW